MEGESPSFKAPISFVDIHILVVDDDPIALAILSAMLRTWKYQVVTAKNPFEALDTLRMKKGLFDLVISDLHMPQMNGLELQNKVRQEFDLPVVMISADEKESVILESLEKGAAFYIVKPVKVDDLKHVWQYAVAAKKGKSKVSSLTSSIAIGNYAGNNSYSVNILSSSFGNEESKHINLKRKASSKWCKEKYCHPPKRAKVVWTNSLHNRFLHAIRQIGLHKAVPKRILEFMNVPGLTRENIASHLQKYRLFLKRVTDDGFFPIQGFSEDTTSGTSFAPFLPSMVSNNVQPSLNEFPKLQLHKQPSKERSNSPNPNCSFFSTQKALVGSSITHLGHEQVLKSAKFHPSDVPSHYRDDGLAINNPHMHQNLSLTQSDSSTSYTQRPDMFINYPSMQFVSIENNPNFSSSASDFSNDVFSGMRMNKGEDKLMINTGQLGFNGPIVDESYQFLSTLASINQHDDTSFVQTSLLQSYDPRNQDVFPLDFINQKQHSTKNDVCRLFMEENNNCSSFEQKDEEERLSDRYNVFNEEPNPSMKEALHSDICSSYLNNEGCSSQEPHPLVQLDENKDVRIGKTLDPSDQYKSCSDPIPHQPTKQIEEEIPSFEIRGLQKQENGALASPNEGWDEDLLDILFGDNESERDLQIHLSEIFSKK